MNREDVLSAVEESGWSIERFAAIIEKRTRDDERDKIARRFDKTSMLPITEYQAIRRIRARSETGGGESE